MSNWGITHTQTNNFIFCSEARHYKLQGSCYLNEGKLPTQCLRNNVSTAARSPSFSPKSNITVPLMAKEDLLKVIQEWISQIQDLGKTYKWVQIFENKGSIMGW